MTQSFACNIFSSDIKLLYLRASLITISWFRHCVQLLEVNAGLLLPPGYAALPGTCVWGETIRTFLSHWWYKSDGNINTLQLARIVMISFSVRYKIVSCSSCRTSQTDVQLLNFFFLKKDMNSEYWHHDILIRFYCFPWSKIPLFCAGHLDILKLICHYFCLHRENKMRVWLGNFNYWFIDFSDENTLSVYRSYDHQF